MRRALGVFVLWVAVIHLACLLAHKLRGPKRSSVLSLGLNCLLLTTNNTGCIGYPVLLATVGAHSAVLSMLLGACTLVAVGVVRARGTT
jgi:predicted permease